MITKKSHLDSSRFTFVITCVWLTFGFLILTLVIAPDVAKEAVTPAFLFLGAIGSLYKVTKGIEHSKWASTETHNGEV